jgi:carbamoyltransferase
VGEWTTTAFGIGRGNAIELRKEIRFPHSLGLLYSTITAYLGFSVNNSEYKVMGLSPYGQMNRTQNPWYAKMRSVLDIKPDGSYKLNMEYFVYQYSDRMPSQRLCTLLGGPIRQATEPMEDRHRDIAAAVQLITEDVVLAMLRFVHMTIGCDQVVLSGGVALNSVCNGKILSETGFKKVWIQPNAGDGGNSMGAALFVQNVILGRPRNYVLEHAYLGSQYSSDAVEEFLQNAGIHYEKFPSPEELISVTAHLLKTNQVVGWFQGRMEWGPRALGARSILSNAGDPEMKAILNDKVKHRESFRPFAPVVCIEDAKTYFECDLPIPKPTDFMLMVYPIRKEFQAKLPAVTHVDGSGRLQTVRREQSPLYYDLIKAFGKMSGIPILVNTSFNIRGEPIVATPQDAYRCMMGTGIDCLVMENFLIRRKDNPKDIWDSETLAHD